MITVERRHPGSAAPSRTGPGPIGLWLNGARGSVATTTTTGLLALRAGLTPPLGCVTARPPLVEAPLVDWADIRVGGHDVVDTPLVSRAQQLAENGVVPPRVLSAVRDELAGVEPDLRPGYDPRTHTGPLREAVRRLAGDISDFRARYGLGRVVVVNVSATEERFPAQPEHEDIDALEVALADPGRRILPVSSVAAYAAFEAGCAFVDFTPSTGARLRALDQLAERRQLPYAGSDGKTGETLVRTVLAPMFTARALHVLSWAGVNLLGGGDGATLQDREKVKSKLASKSGVLPALLGEDVTAPLHIDNVPDLGDHKTAWDHVSFEGFLGVRMSMQLTWSGIDSVLAAPLVLDLARLVAAAHAAGLSGPLVALGFFFKDPIGSAVHGLADQEARLAEWAACLDGARVG